MGAEIVVGIGVFNSGPDTVIAGGDARVRAIRRWDRGRHGQVNGHEFTDIRTDLDLKSSVDVVGAAWRIRTATAVVNNSVLVCSGVFEINWWHREMAAVLVVTGTAANMDEVKSWP